MTKIADIQTTFTRALRFHQSGMIPEAQVLYREILEQAPEHFDSCHLLGTSLVQTGMAQEGVSIILKAIQLKPNSAEAYYNLAHGWKGLEDFENALICIESALAIHHSDAEYHFERGNILTELDRRDEALISYQQAVRLQHDYFEAFNNIGITLNKLEQPDKAILNYNKAISLKPDFAEAYNNRGNALKELRRIDEALASYDKAISLKPDYAEACYNRGNALTELRRFDEALASYDKAISLKPDHAEACYNRGNTLKELRRLEEALASYDKAIRLKPDYAGAYSNRGNVLIELRRLDEALANYDKAISLKPDYAEACNNRGNALKELRRLDEALASYDKAISLKPDYAEAYSNRGKALKELNRLDEAMTSYDKAISLRPDFPKAEYEKSFLMLQQGSFLEGFKLHLSRWNADDFNCRAPSTDVALWDGRPIDGDVLLWAEQGIGDEVFYASMLSLLDTEKQRIFLSADRRLHPIYARSFPNLNLIDRRLTETRISGDFSRQAPIGNLGHLLEVDQCRLRRRRYPYLRSNADRKSQLRQSCYPDSGIVCGISWRSGNRKLGRHRTIDLVDLAPLWACQNMSFVNLQYGNVESEIEAIKDSSGRDIKIVPEVDVFNDIDGLLALIDMCDFVLTIDNVTAHLAGAVGKRGVVLVPRGSGRYWYWGGESPSHWYPSLNLVYQNRVGDWTTAIEEAVKVMTKVVTERIVEHPQLP